MSKKTLCGNWALLENSGGDTSNFYNKSEVDGLISNTSQELKTKIETNTTDIESINGNVKQSQLKIEDIYTKLHQLEEKINSLLTFKEELLTHFNWDDNQVVITFNGNKKIIVDAANIFKMVDGRTKETLTTDTYMKRYVGDFKNSLQDYSFTPKFREIYWGNSDTIRAKCYTFANNEMVIDLANTTSILKSSIIGKNDNRWDTTGSGWGGNKR